MPIDFAHAAPVATLRPRRDVARVWLLGGGGHTTIIMGLGTMTTLTTTRPNWARWRAGSSSYRSSETHTDALLNRTLNHTAINTNRPNITTGPSTPDGGVPQTMTLLAQGNIAEPSSHEIRKLA